MVFWVWVVFVERFMMVVVYVYSRLCWKLKWFMLFFFGESVWIVVGCGVGVMIIVGVVVCRLFYMLFF